MNRPHPLASLLAAHISHFSLHIARSSQTDSPFVNEQFKCPLQYHSLFPLHDRVKPMEALRNLSNNALGPFTVQNRPYTFAYR
jgi:hypothetical protein